MGPYTPIRTASVMDGSRLYEDDTGAFFGWL